MVFRQYACAENGNVSENIVIKEKNTYNMCFKVVTLAETLSTNLK